MGDDPKRTYLVVIDDSAEARVALRFAARRAAKTNGRIEVLGIVEAQDFVQFGGVQAAIEEEQRLRIEGVVSAAVGEILDEAGIEAKIIVQQGIETRLLNDRPHGRTCETRRAMVGLEPDSPHDLGVHTSQCPLNGGNNPTGTLARSTERYDYGDTVCPLDR